MFASMGSRRDDSVKVETDITWTESAHGIFNHCFLERGLGLVNFFWLLLLPIMLHQQLNARLGRREKFRCCRDEKYYKVQIKKSPPYHPFPSQAEPAANLR